MKNYRCTYYFHVQRRMIPLATLSLLDSYRKRLQMIRSEFKSLKIMFYEKEPRVYDHSPCRPQDLE